MSKVSSGRGDPVASMAAPPTRASVNWKSTPSRSPAALRRSTATREISGPIPSPGRTATLQRRHTVRQVRLRPIREVETGLQSRVRPPLRRQWCENVDAIISQDGSQLCGCTLKGAVDVALGSWGRTFAHLASRAGSASFPSRELPPAPSCWMLYEELTSTQTWGVTPLQI